MSAKRSPASLSDHASNDPPRTGGPAALQGGRHPVQASLDQARQSQVPARCDDDVMSRRGPGPSEPQATSPDAGGRRSLGGDRNRELKAGARRPFVNGVSPGRLSGCGSRVGQGSRLQPLTRPSPGPLARGCRRQGPTGRQGSPAPSHRSASRVLLPRALPSARDAAIGDLDPVAVADARLDLGSYRIAFVVLPAEGLVAAINQGVERQCTDAGAFDDHLAVGVHPGQDLCCRGWAGRSRRGACGS